MAGAVGTGAALLTAAVLVGVWATGVRRSMPAQPVGPVAQSPPPSMPAAAPSPPSTAIPVAPSAPLPVRAPAPPVATAASPSPTVPVAPGPPATPLKEKDPKDLFAAASPAVVVVTVYDGRGQLTGLGSGFIAASEGVLVTNYHVVQGAAKAKVRLQDNSEYLVDGATAVDPETDLAVIVVRARNLPVLPVSQGPEPAVGSRVYAIGNPKGLNNTLSDGLVSGYRLDHGRRLLQTSVPITHGSSGGALVSAAGEVVGVTTQGLPGEGNLNFAVPASEVNRLLKAQGPVRPLQEAAPAPMKEDVGKTLALADQALKEEKWQIAARILAGLQQEAPTDPRVWWNLGRLHFALGNFDLAITSCRKAVSLKGDFAEAYWLLGTACLCLDRAEPAISAFQLAVQAKPDFALAHFGLGQACKAGGRKREAVNAWSRAIELDPLLADAYCSLAWARHEDGRDREAIDLLTQAISRRPDHAQSYVVIGLLHRLTGKEIQALSAFRSAARLDPQGEWGQYALQAITEIEARKQAQVDADVVRRKLASVLPKLEFSGISLRDALTFLHDVMEVPVYVNWGSLAKVGVQPSSPVNVRLTNCTAAEAIRAMLLDVNRMGTLGFVVYQGAIVISTRNDLPPP